MTIEVRSAPGAGHQPRSVRSRRSWPLAVALAMLAGASPLVAQQQEGARVIGTVTSAETGQPLSGVQISVKNAPIGTLSNNAGHFSLQPPSPNDTLVFTSIGFATLEEPIDGRTTVNVQLDVSAVALDEIVVVGYGTQQRRDLTGSVARVEGDKVTAPATPSVAQALQGKVAGVQVTPQSGEPGEDAIIRIRGVGTLNDASPLYVVDGMLVNDIQFLSSEDIESVDVLKDASATAIYGSRGANGVIIITTKKGGNAGTTSYHFNAYAGSQSVLRKIDLVNATQYAQLANELAENQGLAPYFPSGYNGSSTDWQDAIFQSAPIQNYQLTASGGTDKVDYYFSANYAEQEGVVPHSTFKRATIRVNNSYQLSQGVTLGHNLNFSYTDNQQAPSVLSAIYRAEPTVSPENGSGDFNALELSSAGNPDAVVYYTRNDGGAERLVGNVYLQADLPRNLQFRSSFGLDYDRGNLRTFSPEFFVSPEQQNQTSRVSVRFDNADSWLWENTLTWNYASDPHRLTLLGGMTAQSFSSENVGGSRVNVAGEAPSLWYLNAGAEDGQTNFDGASDWRMLSYLFRANYSYQDRYLFTGSLRADGSSRFQGDNRYGWFPSLALGWNLAEEPFMQDVDWVSALKLRGSWGKIGNDKIGAYPGIPLVTGNLNYVLGEPQSLVFGAAPVALANPDVKWEETKQYNVGVDAALAGNRLNVTLDYYNRTTDGILVQVPIPNYVGVNSEPFVNAAKVRNTGFEGTVGWTGRVGGVGIELNANGSTINNEVLALGQGNEEIFGGGLGNEIAYTTRTVVGQPIGSFWGYEVDGVYQSAEDIANSPYSAGVQPGDLKFADTNGRDANGDLTGMPNDTVNSDDMTFIGSPIPDFIYGFDATFRLGAFDLALGFSGQSGNQVFNAKKAVRFEVENFETSYLNRWTGPGTSDTEPRVTNAGHNYQSSERFIEDGSFFKLHTASLGYQLPEELAASLRVDAARLYVSATNVFLLTDYTGYTPELTARSVIASGLDVFNGVYPPARVITFGLDVTF